MPDKETFIVTLFIFLIDYIDGNLQHEAEQ